MNGWKTRALLGLATGLLLLPGIPRMASAATAANPADADKPGTAAPREKTIHQRVVLIDDQGKSTFLDSTPRRLAGGYLGVGLLDLTPELRTHFGVPEEAGVLVSKVEPGSPAEKAGIKVGDILTAVDGKPATSSIEVRSRIRSGDEGTQATVELWRKGKVQSVTATLEKRNRPEFDLAPLIFRKDGKDGGDRLFLQLDGDDSLPLKIEPGRPIPLQRLQGRETELEKRLKYLEKKIKDLEHQLEKQQR